MVWHAPGVVVGLYFLTLQFVATINLSYLVLLAGAIFLLLAQPVLAWQALFSKATALAFALFLSTLLSVYVADKNIVKAGLAVSQLPGLLIYLLVVLCVRSANQLIFVAASFFISLCINTTLFFSASLHSELSRAVQLIYFSSQPLFLAANDMLMYVIFLPLMVWIARLWRGRPGILLAGCYLLVLSLLAVLLLSRLSMLIIAVCCFGYLGIAHQRRLWYAVLIVVALAAVALLVDDSLANKVRTMDLARVRTWVAATAMFADAQWLGNGPGSFSALYPAYFNEMPEVIRFGREIRNIGWAHSLFFESAAEKGLLGLAVIVAYFFYLFAALNRKLRSGEDGFIRALRAAVMILLVASCFELSLLRVWGIYIIYLILGLVAVFTAARNSTAVDCKQPASTG